MADAPRGAVDLRGLEVLLGQLDDAVAFVDRDGAIRLTNRADELPAARATPQIADLDQALEIFPTQLWRVIAWDQGAEQMYGWSGEQARGRELRSFMTVTMRTRNTPRSGARLPSARGRQRGL
jgi:PAS domain-containing protein